MPWLQPSRNTPVYCLEVDVHITSQPYTHKFVEPTSQDLGLRKSVLTLNTHTFSPNLLPMFYHVCVCVEVLCGCECVFFNIWVMKSWCQARTLPLLLFAHTRTDTCGFHCAVVIPAIEHSHTVDTAHTWSFICTQTTGRYHACMSKFSLRVTWIFLLYDSCENKVSYEEKGNK